MSTIHDIMHPPPLLYPLSTTEVCCNICGHAVDDVKQTNILFDYERDCEKRVGLVLGLIAITVGAVAGLLVFVWFVHRYIVHFYPSFFDFLFSAALGTGFVGAVATLAMSGVMEIARRRLMRVIRKEIKESVGYREKLIYMIEAGEQLSAHWAREKSHANRERQN